MSRIIITGDTHGGAGIHRLSNRFAPPLKELGEGDAVIIAGDFGLVWDEPQSKEERYWLRWLSEKSYDVLFVDGNHENHDLLQKLPAAEMYGGVVGIAAPGVYHLRRGQVYDIAGHRVFAMGGAHSTDKDWRIPGFSWWADEVPDDEERARAMGAARAGGIDFVITHEAPRGARDSMFPQLADADDEYSDWLDELDAVLKAHGGYWKWFFGHHHVDRDDGDGYVCVFERLYEVGAGWLETRRQRYLDIGAMPEPANPIGYTVAELAEHAGLPVPVIERAVDDALYGSTYGVGENGEALVYASDLRRVERWLRRYGA